MSAFLSALSESQSRRTGETPPLEICIEALQAKAARLAAPCPFRTGDVVTVRVNTDIKGCGEPHVVVDVLAEPITDTRPEAGSNRYLARYTMRVAHFAGEAMTVHAVDCSCFEPWTAEHAAAWTSKRASRDERRARRLKPDTPLSEVLWLLRGEIKRINEAKIAWKKGDLVEIVGHEQSRASRPMLFEGKSIGFVERVDHTDDTTRVVYYDSEGDRCAQWFKPGDLRPYAVVEPA